MHDTITDFPEHIIYNNDEVKALLPDLERELYKGGSLPIRLPSICLINISGSKRN
jgi:hypothetical protein